MFTLVIGITLWYLTGLVCNRHNIQYPFDKKTTLPLRGILATLIVLHHFQILYPEEYTWLSDFGFIGAPVCSVFFFLSGYGLMKSWLINPISLSKNFISKRIIKLAPPMALVILLNIFIHIIKNHSSVNSIEDELIKYGNYIFMPHLWFVIVLMGCYFTFYYSTKLFKNPFYILISVGIIVGLYCVLMSNIDSIETFWWVSTPGFLGGMCVTVFEYNKNVLHSIFWHVFSILLIIVSSTYYVIGYYDNILPVWGLQFICLLPIMVYICTIQQPVYSNSILNYMGKLSYEIYLVHVLVMQTLHPLIENNFILIFMTFVVTILLSKLIYNISNYYYA